MVFILSYLSRMSQIQSPIREHCKLILTARTLVFLVVFKKGYSLLYGRLHARIGVGNMLDSITEGVMLLVEHRS